MAFRNLRFITRSLARNPVMVTTAILTLSLGIGASTALFTITNQVLLKTLPVHDPQQLALFRWEGDFIGGTNRGMHEKFSYPGYLDLRSAMPETFQGIAAHYQDTIDVADRGVVQRAVAEVVSGNYFDVLGTPAVLGRTLRPDDDLLKKAEPFAVISYAYWQQRFGGSHAVLDRVIDVNGHPMTIVGVAPRGFRGFDPGSPTDVFLPMAMKPVVTPTWDDMTRRNSIWLEIFARLQPGVSLRAAENQMSGAFTAALRNDLQAHSKSRQRAASYLRNKLTLTDASRGMNWLAQEIAKPIYLLLAMVGALLLITCANVAGLWITRAAARQKEIAIRLSIGASRRALIWLMMAESACVALLSGVLGLWLAKSFADLLVSTLPFPNIAIAIDTVPDPSVLTFALGATSLALLFFGFIPAWQATRPDVVPALKLEAGSLTFPGGPISFRRFLIVGQVALSVALVFACGFFAANLRRLMSVNPGMKTENVLQFTVDPSMHKYTSQRTRQLFIGLQERLQHAPGISDVSASAFPVLADNGWQNSVRVEGYRLKPDEGIQAGFTNVLPGFFQTVGVPLRLGRGFNSSDWGQSKQVVLINETFVKRYIEGNPIGLHLGIGGNSVPLTYEIIGVVADSRQANLRDAPQPFTYFPLLQDEAPSSATFYVRTNASSTTTAHVIRQVLATLDPNLPIYDVRTLEQQIDQTHLLDRLFAWLSSAFGTLATLLASIGLYGLIAYTVAQRTRELGIRMALGAERRNILATVMREVALLTSIGIIAGLPLLFASRKLLESKWSGLQPTSFALVVATVFVIGFATALAGYLPARRATRIDPAIALRYE